MGCELPVQRLRRDRLLHEATRVLGADRARAWVKAPNAALGNVSPESLTETLEGLELALSELESLRP